MLEKEEVWSDLMRRCMDLNTGQYWIYDMVGGSLSSRRTTLNIQPDLQWNGFDPLNCSNKFLLKQISLLNPIPCQANEGYSALQKYSYPWNFFGHVKTPNFNVHLVKLC
ncbi:hypothetical protein AMECASPLE_001318 [Ameca splendens]|uniref:Uncharacterized protein n=1 Tax=Ameca splendens TaxID=208324 RepID=A0ABV0YX99_9TELE